MPFQIEIDRDMEEEDLRISVVDVYDLASEIGKEFEKIIDRNGPDAVTGLMPRVISALEQLEKLATRHESTSSYIQELRATIIHLENEKIGKAEDRQRYERELEDIEDRLREESHELVAMVSRLQDENRKLSSSLAKSEGTVIANGSTPEVDLKVVTRLQEVIEAQREQLHKTEKECHLKTSELENLKSQIEKMNHVNRELRRRQRTNATQMRSLIDERAELQAALQEETRTVTVLRQRLGLAQKENEDLASSSVSSDSLDLTNKLVFDRDDPNRPRFTMTELKEILYERNELKARVSDLEDELEMYRPKDERQRSHIICPPVEMVEAEGGLQPPTDSLTPPPSLSDSLSTEIQDTAEEEEELEPPVQGPMPYEPDDAPWKKGESGIRKFGVCSNFLMKRMNQSSHFVSVDSLVKMGQLQDLAPREAFSAWAVHEYYCGSGVDGANPRAAHHLKIARKHTLGTLSQCSFLPLYHTSEKEDSSGISVQEDIFSNENSVKKKFLNRLSPECLPSSFYSYGHLGKEKFLSNAKDYFLDCNTRKCSLGGNATQCSPVDSVGGQSVDNKVREFFRVSNIRKHSVDSSVGRCSHCILSDFEEFSLDRKVRENFIDNSYIDCGKHFVENNVGRHSSSSTVTEHSQDDQFQRSTLNRYVERYSKKNGSSGHDSLFYSLHANGCHWYYSRPGRIQRKKNTFQRRLWCLPALPWNMWNGSSQFVPLCSHKIDLSNEKSHINWKYHDCDEFLVPKFAFTDFYRYIDYSYVH